ncbi:MAG: discoidin domain-containing protein, partial [Bacteroidota bacterium]
SDQGIPTTTVDKVFDGNLNSKWTSGTTNINTQNIYVDLGTRYDLCRVILRWTVDYAKTFDIQVSDDATSWTTIQSISNNTTKDDYLSLKGTGRYVRVNMTARATTQPYSLYEFEVYGTKTDGDCAAPTGLDKGAVDAGSAVLKWASTGASTYSVQYKAAAAADWITVTSTTNTITLQQLSCGTDYLFRVKASCVNGGASVFSPPASFTTTKCTTTCGPLPTRWTTEDIGDVGLAGSACYSNEIFELNGSGRNTSLNADAFHFANKTFVGDGEIKARIVSLDQSGGTAGIMIRESMAPGVKYAFIGLTAAGAAFQYRLTTDGNSTAVTNNVNIKAPYWVRLVKVKSLYTGYISVDGVSWTAVGQPIELAFGADAPVYAGLSITSYSNTVLSKATIDNYMLSGIMELELKSFTASVTLSKTVMLDWVTTLEGNIGSFTIEKSGDNVNYTEVDSITAVNKGKFVQNYSYQVMNPKKGVNYFRLRIRTLDGKISYSALAYVNISDSPAPTVYSNPAKEKVNVAQSTTDPIRYVQVFDISGALVRTINNEAVGSPVLTISGLTNGIYIMEIKTSTSVFRKKFVIAN